MQIKATISVEEACHDYFGNLSFFIAHNLDPKAEKPKIEFYKIKTFMNTAFNNLQKLDATIYYDKEIQNLRKLIRDTEKIYIELTKRIAHPKLSFDEIFLMAQPEIVEKDNFERFAKQRIKSLGELSKNLEIITTDVKKIDIKDQNPEAKRVQSAYVDTIHEKANLNEKLKEFMHLKALYSSHYYQEFVEVFVPKAEKYKQLIKQILDQKIVELETLLWQKASNSKSINAFFQKAQITGRYSTKIYLEYYLKTLDPSKMSDEHRELKELYEYLKTI